MNIVKFCADKFYRLLARIASKRFKFISDKNYISLKFRANMGYWMDWDNPKTYNEKLQWLKAFYHDPLWTKLVDKYEVKEYVAKASVSVPVDLLAAALWKGICFSFAVSIINSRMI